jgi:hypothetical protein
LWNRIGIHRDIQERLRCKFQSKKCLLRTFCRMLWRCTKQIFGYSNKTAVHQWVHAFQFWVFEQTSRSGCTDLRL